MLESIFLLQQKHYAQYYVSDTPKSLVKMMTTINIFP